VVVNSIRLTEVDTQSAIHPDSWTLTALHGSVFDSEGVQEATIETLQELASDTTTETFFNRFDELGITDCCDGLVESYARSAMQGDRDALFDLLRLLRQLGSKATVGLQTRSEDIHSVARLFELTEVTPTIEIQLNAEFRETRRSQVDELVDYILTLSRGAEIVLCGSAIDRQYLRHHYGEKLPESVTVSNNAGRQLAPTALLDEVGYDNLAVTMLRSISENSNGLIAYNALQTEFSQYARPTISRALNEVLSDAGLIEMYGSRGDRRIELLASGYEYLDYLDDCIDVQNTESDCVTETPQLQCNNRVDNNSPREEGTGLDRPTAEATATTASNRYSSDRYYSIEYLSRPEIVTAAEQPSNTISLSNCNIGHRKQEGGWGYLDESHTLVVSADYDNPLQHLVTVARTLLDDRTYRHVLTDKRLSELDVQIELSKPFLWSTRNFGYLPEEIDTGKEYVESLREARDKLVDKTRRLNQDETDRTEERRLRSEVTKTAMGLIGNARHLFDLLDIEVAWEIRVPDFTSDFGADRIDELVKTIANNASIASKYGHHVAYRHLYESRTDKREQALEPTIDESNPYGELLGSISVIGNFGGRTEEFASALEDRLSSPAELHDDAPEFAIRVPVETTPGRSGYSRVVRRMCEWKGLEATPKAVTLFSGLCRTPYDAAVAIGNGLSKETDRREIRISEVRLAVSSLPSNRLLEGATPGVRAMTKTLLGTDKPLTRTELADLADISTETVRRHLDVLLGSGMATENDGKIRLRIAFNTDNERHSDRVPSFMLDELAFGRDVVYEVFIEIDELTEEVMQVWTANCPEVDQLKESHSWVGWVLPLATALTQGKENCRRSVAFGSDIEQPPTNSQSTKATAVRL